MNISSLFHSTLATGKLVAQFGQGITPNSEGIFAPPNLEQNTILTYTNNTISFLVTLLTTLGGLFFLYEFLMGGFMWLQSGGEQKKVQEARERITQAVLGLIVITIAYSVIGLVGTIFGIEILNPAGFLEGFLNSASSGGGAP
jgi:hypothetical protein